MKQIEDDIKGLSTDDIVDIERCLNRVVTTHTGETGKPQLRFPGFLSRVEPPQSRTKHHGESDYSMQK